MSDDPFAGLSEYVSASLATEWQRKSSFETRAFAVVSANVGMVTLAFVLARELALKGFDGVARQFLLGALAATVVSIVSAVVAARPGNFGTVYPEGLRHLLTKIVDGLDPVETAHQLVEVQLKDLEAARNANDLKVLWIGVSFAAFAVQCAMLSFALIAAA